MSATAARPSIAPERLRRMRAVAALAGLALVLGAGELVLRLRPTPRLPLPPHYDPAQTKIEWIEVPGGCLPPLYQP